MENELNTLAASHLVDRILDAQDFIAAIFEGGSNA